MALDDIVKTRINDPTLAQFFHRLPGETPIEGIKPIDWDGCAMAERVYVSYLVRRMFGIHRLPTHHESIGMDNRERLEAIFSAYSEAKVSEHLEELQRLHQYTVEALREAVGNTITVFRGLKTNSSGDDQCPRADKSPNFALLAACAKRYAEQNGDSEATIHGNTFDFYASVNNERAHNNGVRIKRTVPIEDVVLCHHSVDGFTDQDADILVVNRSIRGIVTLSAEDIEIDEDFSVPQAYYLQYCKAVEKGNLCPKDVLEGFYWWHPTPGSKVYKTFERRVGKFESSLRFLGDRLDNMLSTEEPIDVVTKKISDQ